MNFGLGQLAVIVRPPDYPTAIGGRRAISSADQRHGSDAAAEKHREATSAGGQGPAGRAVARMFNLLHFQRMKTAGIREARLNLGALIEEVRKGREVLLTDRGRPVARLVPPRPAYAKPFRSLKRFRRAIRLRGEPLSRTIERDREDRE
jgi:prevent-host-death family protein